MVGVKGLIIGGDCGVSREPEPNRASSGFDHSRSSTTMSSNVALWFLPFSLGLSPKHVYWPPSSKVMFHNRMETLLLTLLPTNSTRFRMIFTTGITPCDTITDSHTWRDQQAVRDPEGSARHQHHLDTHPFHGSVVIKLPVEVEVLDADTAGVGARQHDCAAIKGLHEGDLPYRHLKSLRGPCGWEERGVRSNQAVKFGLTTQKKHLLWGLLVIKVRRSDVLDWGRSARNREYTQEKFPGHTQRSRWTYSQCLLLQWGKSGRRKPREGPEFQHTHF